MLHQFTNYQPPHHHPNHPHSPNTPPPTTAGFEHDKDTTTIFSLIFDSLKGFLNPAISFPQGLPRRFVHNMEGARRNTGTGTCICSLCPDNTWQNWNICINQQIVVNRVWSLLLRCPRHHHRTCSWHPRMRILVDTNIQYLRPDTASQNVEICSVKKDVNRPDVTFILLSNSSLVVI